MEQTRSANLLLALVFLMVIAVEPILQLTHDLRKGATPLAFGVFSRTPSATNLRAFEETLRDQSILANTVRPYVQYWRYASMGDLGRNGVLGREDWLFYRPGIQFLVEPWGDIEATEPLTAIVSFRDQLRAQGIELLVVVVPGKESVHPEYITTRAPRFSGSHVTDFVDDLRELEVEAMYLRPDEAQRVGPPKYLKQDTHWTPGYAQECANLVAARALALGWIELGSAAYGTQSKPVQRHGDILRMAKSQPLLESIHKEKFEAIQVTEPDSLEHYKDSPDASVLVLGDSFLRIFERDEPGSAGFVSHLARALQQTVTSLINDGGASTLVRMELRRKPELLRGKKLVIWEFVDRDLRFGMEGWQEIEIPAPN